MILNKFIEIKISRKNIDHFLQYYKNIQLKDIIEVDPYKLQNSCNIKINASCDICKIERNIKYQAYYKNINSCIEYPIYTCDKCSHIKIKSFNKKKYGVDYFSQTDEYNKKFKKTMLMRWGVEYALQSDELKDKVKKTNLEKFGFENPFMDKDRIKSIFKEKYGVTHPSQVDEFLKKIKKTNLEKYGYENIFLSDVIKGKIKETNFKKYGGHPMKNDITLNKLKSTNLEKYGYESILSIPEKREQIKNTWLIKYGVDNPMISEDIRKDFIITNDINYIKYIGNNSSLFNCTYGHEFTININNYHSRLKHNIKLCTICNPIGENRSIKEDELYRFIKSIYNGEIIKSYRKGLEIDIYLPDLNLGFEFNGLYWHSEKYKDKNYHLNKYNHFMKIGINIINIWEDDWDIRKDILKSQIINYLGICKNNISEKNCDVREITDSKIISKFLNDNHILGNTKSSLKLGLYNNDKLVSVMTFDQSENQMKLGDWIMNRFCDILNYNIIDSANRLLKHFIKNYHVSSIITYTDRDYNLFDYETVGFSKLSEGDPEYKYVFENNRFNESDLIRKSHTYKIWDCGKIKYELSIK